MKEMNKPNGSIPRNPNPNRARGTAAVAATEMWDYYDQIYFMWEIMVKQAREQDLGDIPKDVVKYEVISLMGDWSVKALDSQVKSCKLLSLFTFR